jgi:hypothetical protein
VLTTKYQLPTTNYAEFHSLFGWLVSDGWCWFVLREEYCWLVAGGWFVLREKYGWLVVDKSRVNRLADDEQKPKGRTILQSIYIPADAILNIK